MPSRRTIFAEFLSAFSVLSLGSIQGEGGLFPDKLEPVLSIPLPGKFSGPILVYPNLDKPEGVAIPLDTGKALFLSGQGESLWITTVGETLNGPLASGDLDGDGTMEIVGAANTSEAFALSAKGELLWRYDLAGGVGAWGGASCADLDGDGRAEVIISNTDGWLTCLSGAGALLWRMHADNFNTGQSSVGDVDGDGQPEIVYGTENSRLLCLDSGGNLEWFHPASGKFGRSYVALADLDEDGLPEAVWSTSYNTATPKVYAAHACDGSPFWSSPTILHGYGSCSIADLTGDGMLEVIFGDRANTIYAFSGVGKEIWRTTTGGRGFMFPQSIADVDGDGKVEILAVCRNANDEGKSFFILDGETGKKLAEYPIAGTASLSPTVCDWDGDGNLEVIFDTPGSSSLDIYRFGAKVGAKTPWPVKRFDPSRTGFVPPRANPKQAVRHPEPSGSLPLELPQEILWGENRLQIGWPKPVPPKAFVLISVVDSASIRTSRIITLDPEKPSTEFSIPLNTPGHHDVTAVLWDESVVPAKPVARGSVDCNLGGVEVLSSWVGRQLARIRETAGRILPDRPAAARMLLEKAALNEGSVAGFAQRAKDITSTPVPVRDALAAEINEYREGIERLTDLTALAEKSSNSSVAVWEDENPWDNSIPLYDPPGSLDATPELNIWTCLGETEHRAMWVANLRHEPLDVQFRLPLHGPITAREVLLVPRRGKPSVPDALPKTAQSNTLHLAPGEVRQVWFEISASGLLEGMQTYPVLAVPIGHDQDRFKILFRVEAAPVNLADTPQFHICNWANPKTIQDMSDDPGTVKEVLEQGMTVWTGYAPGRSCDEQGNLTGKMDWTPLDKQIDLLDPNKAFFLVGGPGVSAPASINRGSAEYKRGLRSAMREMASYMAKKGWPLNRWAYYPMDEPGLFGDVAEFKRMVETAKEACPEIQIYADPAGGVTRENFGDLTDDLDVWAPELAMLRRNDDLRLFFLETKDTLWCYEAPGECKSLLPLGYYRAQCLTAAWMGFEGAGHWVFVGVPGDLWSVSDGAEYGDMYYDGSRFVQSRRWLSFMEGAEDGRFILMLKAAAAECRRRGMNPPELAEVEDLLGPKLKHLIRMQWEQDDIARNLIDYELDWKELQSLRREIARLTVALRQRAMEGKDK